MLQTCHVLERRAGLLQVDPSLYVPAAVSASRLGQGPGQDWRSHPDGNVVRRHTTLSYNAES